MKQIIFTMKIVKQSWIYLIILASLSITITGCSPRVTTSIFESYPTLPIDSVEVFDAEDSIPSSATVIGTVAVKDRGTTTKCNYDYVLFLAKKETAENGGNGFQIMKHRNPNVISTCHQIVGNMLHITDSHKDTTSLDLPEETFGSQVLYTEPRKKELNVVKITGAGSSITSKMTTADGKEFSPKSGKELLVEFEHIGSQGIGFGINFKYFATNFGKTYFGLNIDANMIYLGPSLVYSAIMAKRIRWDLAIGLGAAIYNDTYSKTELGFGLLNKIGIDYMFSQKLGLGIELNNDSHRFKKPKEYKLEKNEYYGINTLSVGIGLRLYF